MTIQGTNWKKPFATNKTDKKSLSRIYISLLYNHKKNPIEKWTKKAELSYLKVS